MSDVNTTIWKYPLKLAAEQTIEVPLWANGLCLQMQGRTPCLWMAVNPDAQLTSKKIVMVGTGHPELTGDMAYLGTVQIDGFVWHYFEVI